MNQTESQILNGYFHLLRKIIRVWPVPVHEDQVAQFQQDNVLLHYKLLYISLPSKAPEYLALNIRLVN